VPVGWSDPDASATGVVHQHVDAAVPVQDLPHLTRRLVGVGYVQLGDLHFEVGGGAAARSGSALGVSQMVATA